MYTNTYKCVYIYPYIYTYKCKYTNIPISVI